MLDWELSTSHELSCLVLIKTHEMNIVISLFIDNDVNSKAQKN